MNTLVTPTTGHPRLKHAILSAQRQSHGDFRHLVVVDGRERQARAEAIMEEVNFDGDVLVLPEATGAGGFCGHLIYAAVTFLVKSEFVALLDEDNTIEANHLESLHRLCEEHRLDWAYALRSVFTDSGDELNDDCHSLGLWPVFNGNYHHIDTSCYWVRRQVLKEGALVWDRPVIPEKRASDQMFCGWLMHHHWRGFTTGLYTTNYWLGPRSRTGRDKVEKRLEYYRIGNAVQAEVYRVFPWCSTQLGEDVPYGNLSFVARDEAWRKRISAVVARVRGDDLAEQGADSPKPDDNARNEQTGAASE